MSRQTFSVPIKLEIGVRKKKTHYLNLNNYRNWHFQVNNAIKQTFKIQMLPVLRELQPLTKPCKVTYTIYYPNKREFDLDNMGSIISKFTHDALVEAKILEDDNWKFVAEVVYEYGGVDKEDPRCDVTLEELE